MEWKETTGDGSDEDSAAAAEEEKKLPIAGGRRLERTEAKVSEVFGSSSPPMASNLFNKKKSKSRLCYFEVNKKFVEKKKKNHPCLVKSG